MAQRDYEEQPEAPDLGASVQLESDQQLVGPPGDHDALDAGYSPADRPYALDEDGVTARGMREGDTLDERLRRERGDEPADPDRAGRLTLAGGGAALEAPDDMDAVDVGIDGGAASAEEAAVHVSENPVGVVETEPSVAGSPALDDPELDAVLADDPLADRAGADAARDAGVDGPVVDGAETGWSEPAGTGGDPVGGDLSGRGPDPALPRDPADVDPATREFGDAAAAIDAAGDSDGATAAASGTQDAGPGAWR